MARRIGHSTQQGFALFVALGFLATASLPIGFDTPPLWSADACAALLDAPRLRKAARPRCGAVVVCPAAEQLQAAAVRP